MTVIVGAGTKLGLGVLIGPTYTIVYSNITTQDGVTWITTETDNALITEN
jgi:hypothetical protein